MTTQNNDNDNDNGNHVYDDGISEEELMKQRLLYASKVGDVATMQEIMEGGRVLVDTVLDDVGNTALHWSSNGGHLPAVRYLIEQCNASLRVKNVVLDTVLHRAVWRGGGDHIDGVVTYLLERDRSLLVEKNAEGKRPMDLARSGVVRALLESYDQEEEEEDGVVEVDGDEDDDDDDDDDE